MCPTASASASKHIVLKAPLTGPLVAIEAVPDPVFAQKMVGDGISIDPLDQCLLAPCDGEILQLHNAGHALTLVTENEIEVMIHIGLDTVELNGVGFTPMVRAGDRVRTGDALIAFDADFVARNARSLLTQIIITNSELVTRFEPHRGNVKAGQDDILGLWLGEPPAPTIPELPAPVAASRQTPTTPECRESGAGTEVKSELTTAEKAATARAAEDEDEHSASAATTRPEPVPASSVPEATQSPAAVEPPPRSAPPQQRPTGEQPASAGGLNEASMRRPQAAPPGTAEQPSPALNTGTPTPASPPATNGAPPATSSNAGANSLASEAIAIPNASGLHVRPAAVLANVAKKFRAEIRVQRGEQIVNAKSVVAIMGLEIGHQDSVRLLAEGEDAEDALATLVPLLQAGLGDEGLAPAPAPASVAVSEFSGQTPRPQADNPDLLLGIAAAPGMAIGRVFQLRAENIAIDETGRGAHEEQRRLDNALEEGMVQLEALQARLHEEAEPGRAAIFAAHQELLDDPNLLETAIAAISAGKSAAWAWNQAVDIHAQQLAGLKTLLLAERANDLRDVGLRILRLLTDSGTIDIPSIPPESILITEELTPSTTAHLDRDNVLGFCTLMGGASSHVAILARSLDIPAVAGIESRALDIANGTLAVIDGGNGTLQVNPSPGQLTKAGANVARRSGNRTHYLEKAHDPAVTRDGCAIEVVANIGSLEDARHAQQAGAEGVGLLRTEFLFMDRSIAPDEDEQYRAYRDIIHVIGSERPVVIRTLDVGGDKPLPYLPIPREDNPYLGERGIRVSLDRPEILRLQVRAILRAAAHGQVSMLLPMVTTTDDLRRTRALVNEELQRLDVEAIPLGIMVEVPTVALMASAFAREADFFSIGTNDLTQYALAMDRDHPRLAAAIDALNPGVLRLIAATVEGARGASRPVAVCGSVASDPLAVPFLLGLGITSLSCSVPAIPAIKAQIRALQLADCRSLAQQALVQDSARQVRALYTELSG